MAANKYIPEILSIAAGACITVSSKWYHSPEMYTAERALLRLDLSWMYTSQEALIQVNRHHLAVVQPRNEPFQISVIALFHSCDETCRD